MSKFVIAAVQMFPTADGQVFTTLEEAQAHQFQLDNEALLNSIAENHANDLKLIDRARSGRVNAVKEFLAWYLPWVEAGSPDIERTAFDTPKEERAKKASEEEAAKEELDDSFLG